MFKDTGANPPSSSHKPSIVVPRNYSRDLSSGNWVTFSSDLSLSLLECICFHYIIDVIIICIILSKLSIQLRFLYVLSLICLHLSVCLTINVPPQYTQPSSSSISIILVYTSKEPRPVRNCVNQ